MGRGPLDLPDERPAVPAHRPRGPAREVHSDDMPIEQKADIVDPDDYTGEIVIVDKDAHLRDRSFLAALAELEEPVTIRLEPTAEKNAPSTFPVWVNGKRAEVFQRGQWEEIGYLPIGQIITIKRKALEVIVRAKLDTIQTDVLDRESERPNNVIRRFTSAASGFSVIEDRNPRGVAWLTELRRRNF